MDARSRLQAELERELAEHEASLLLRLLRERSRELSIGDVFELLSTPTGQRVQSRRVAEIVGAAAPAARAANATGEAAMRSFYAAVREAGRPSSARELAAAAGAQGEAMLDALVAVGLLQPVGARPQRLYRPAAEDASGPTTPVLLLAAALLTSLRAAGGRMRQQELRRLTGSTEERVRRALGFLLRARLVTRVGRNSGARYGLADAASATH